MEQQIAALLAQMTDAQFDRFLEWAIADILANGR